MFSILGGKEEFYQWDLNQKLIVHDASITEVHFCNKTDDCALVCQVHNESGQRLVNVPNILLQYYWDVRAYAYKEDQTIIEQRFKVKPRSKPADYIYTETEVYDWKAFTEEVNNTLYEFAESESQRNENVAVLRAEMNDISAEFETIKEDVEEIKTEQYYNVAYMKNGRLVCEDTLHPENHYNCTGKYIGIDMVHNVSAAEIRFGFSGDTHAGTANAMIITSALGNSMTMHITKGSCHFSVSNINMSLDFYDEKSNKINGYTYNFKSPLEPDTDYTFNISVITDNTDSTKKMLKVTVKQSNASTNIFSGTFKEGTKVWDNFAIKNGRYLILEHFYDNASPVRPYFTGAKAAGKDTDDNTINYRHDFKHQASDGIITSAPSGQIYTLFTNDIDATQKLDYV